MPERLAAAALDFLWLTAELAVLFVLVAGAVAVLGRRVGMRRLQRLLGGGRVAGAVKGIVLGFATPFCTYSAIPVLVALLDAGVRTSAWMGFVLAAPVLDPLVAVAIGVIFGPWAAVVFTAAVFGGVLVAAVGADAAGLRAGRPRSRVLSAAPAAVGDVRHGRGVAVDGAACAPTPPADAGRCLTDPLADGEPWRGWPREVADGVRYAVVLLRGMAVPLLLAVAVAAAITGLVPREVIVRVAGPGNPFAVPVAAIVGTPLYVSGEAFIPVAAALRSQGMRDGAVFALIVAGAGVNLPELAVLARLVDRRVLALLVAAIFAVAMVAGYAVPAVT